MADLQEISIRKLSLINIYAQVKNPSFLIHIYTDSRNIYVQTEIEINMMWDHNEASYRFKTIVFANVANHMFNYSIAPWFYPSVLPVIICNISFLSQNF